MGSEVVIKKVCNMMRTNINRLVILPTALQLGSYILLGLSIDHQASTHPTNNMAACSWQGNSTILSRQPMIDSTLKFLITQSDSRSVNSSPDACSFTVSARRASSCPLRSLHQQWPPLLSFSSNFRINYIYWCLKVLFLHSILQQELPPVFQR
jgi:hypothetical protein